MDSYLSLANETAQLHMLASYFWTVVIIDAIICCIACPMLATRKGGDEAWAFVGGLFLGPFCLLYYIGMPDLITRKLLQEIRDSLSEVREKVLASTDERTSSL
jgi:DNA-binding NarL/FixJ family response regulator